MIEFTGDQVERAATTVKMLQLSAMPGMDNIAIQLNAQPTHKELEVGRIWALALSLATRSDISSLDAAIMILKGMKNAPTTA